MPSDGLLSEKFLNIERARFNMIEQQIHPCKVLDPQVLDSLFVVRREEFVPDSWQALAFADLEIPIGHGQVMLAPRIDARILQELKVQTTDRVLEIGTGSGYLAALLAATAAEVFTVERVPELALSARYKLERSGFDNVTVIAGDGLQGWQQDQPYDAIVFSGAVPEIPPSVLAQLRVGGRLLAFVGAGPVMPMQRVTCVAAGTYVTVSLFETRVPALAVAGTYCFSGALGAP